MRIYHTCEQKMIAIKVNQIKHTLTFKIYYKHDPLLRVKQSVSQSVCLLIYQMNKGGKFL